MKQRVELLGGGFEKHQGIASTPASFIMTGSWPCCQPLSR